MRYYTEEEQRILMMNPFVLFIKDNKAIEYDPAFQLWCIFTKKTHPERSCRSMFEECKFDMSVLSKRLPQERVKRWEERFNIYGPDWYLNEYEFARNINKLTEYIYPNRNLVNQSELKKRIYKEVQIYVENYKRQTSTN
jgi:hypothetical protein